MRLINCEIHGEVAAKVKDILLLRYECSHCAMEREKEEAEASTENDLFDV